MQAETISEVKIYEEDIEYIGNRSCMVGDNYMENGNTGYMVNDRNLKKKKQIIWCVVNVLKRII